MLKDEKFVFFKKFLLGFFDGDGCISITKNNQIRFTLTGGFDFLNSIGLLVIGYVISNFLLIGDCIFCL